MYRAIPVGNRVLSRRWEERSQAAHYEKLRTVRAAIDSASPFVLKSHGSKGKKDLLAEERYTEIERENRILLEKMSTIIQNPQFRSRTVHKKSLNRGLRKRELVKITMENQALLRRLQQRQSSYSTQQWEQERRRNEQILKNIGEFPYQSREDLQERTRAGSLGSRVPSRGELSRRSTVSKPPISAVDLPLLPRLPSNRLLIKRSVSIDGKYFLVEISEREDGLRLTAFDIESPESYSLDLRREEVADILDGTRNFERLLELLAFEDGDLILVEAKGAEKGGMHSVGVSKSKMRRAPSQPQTRIVSGTPATGKRRTGQYGEINRSFDCQGSPLQEVSNVERKKSACLLNIDEKPAGSRKKKSKRSGKKTESEKKGKEVALGWVDSAKISSAAELNVQLESEKKACSNTSLELIEQPTASKGQTLVS